MKIKIKNIVHIKAVCHTFMYFKKNIYEKVLRKINLDSAPKFLEGPDANPILLVDCGYRDTPYSNIPTFEIK